MTIHTVFPERLKTLRESRGLKQEDFAEQLGVARASLSYYESGKRTPDIHFLSKVCEVTGCSSDYLLGYSLYRNNGHESTTKENVVRLAELISGLGNDEQSDYMYYFESAIGSVLHRDQSIPVNKRCKNALKQLLEDIAALNAIYGMLNYEHAKGEGMKTMVDTYATAAPKLLKKILVSVNEFIVAYEAAIENSIIEINGFTREKIDISNLLRELRKSCLAKGAVNYVNKASE